MSLWSRPHLFREFFPTLINPPVSKMWVWANRWKAEHWHYWLTNKRIIILTLRKSDTNKVFEPSCQGKSYAQAQGLPLQARAAPRLHLCNLPRKWFGSGWKRASSQQYRHEPAAMDQLALCGIQKDTSAIRPSNGLSERAPWARFWTRPNSDRCLSKADRKEGLWVGLGLL